MDIEDAIIAQNPYKRIFKEREFLGDYGLSSIEVELGEYSWGVEPILEFEINISCYNDSVTFYSEDEIRKIHEILGKAIEAIDSYGKEDKVQEQAGAADS